ncbi:MAG: DUF4314 domain-containing protein [Clostridia bacterium]|nr:DUF4314 domain-containing protein [Clostridia bacterium]
MISKTALDMLRREYMPGTRVRLISMNDPFTHLPTGAEGSVIAVDDIGTIHIAWDCGNSLGAVYGEDKVVKI